MKRAIFLILAIWSARAFAGPVCPSASTPCSSETVCSAPGVLFCEDWEDGDHTGWEWASGWNSCTTIAGSGGANGSSNALKHFVDTNDCECGYPLYSLPQEQSGPLWMRWYYKVSAGYKFMDQIGAEKVIYFRANNAQDGIAWRIEIGVQAKSGDNTKGEFVMDALGHAPIWQYNGSASHYIDSNTWYCVEASITPNTPGQSNGRVQLWLDDVAYIDYPSQNLKNDGTPMDSVPWISEYYGGNPCVSHPAQSIWYDDLVVRTSRIGCRDSIEVTDPAPPHRVVVTN